MSFFCGDDFAAELDRDLDVALLEALGPPAQWNDDGVLDEKRIGAPSSFNCNWPLGAADAVDVQRHLAFLAILILSLAKLGGFLEREFAGVILPVGDDDDGDGRIAVARLDDLDDAVGERGAGFLRLEAVEDFLGRSFFVPSSGAAQLGAEEVRPQGPNFCRPATRLRSLLPRTPGRTSLPSRS